jgi:hypothetical protein
VRNRLNRVGALFRLAAYATQRGSRSPLLATCPTTALPLQPGTTAQGSRSRGALRTSADSSGRTLCCGWGCRGHGEVGGPTIDVRRGGFCLPTAQSPTRGESRELAGYGQHGASRAPRGND